MTEKTIKGMFLNLEAGLLLPFMLNPQPISFNKAVSWDIEEIPGLPAPIYYFQSGGQKTITFQLFFDASMAGVSSGHYSFLDITGVMGQESIIESFLYPQNIELQNFNVENITKQRKFVSPPLVTLIIGMRFWQGYLMSAPIEETKFDKNLFPTQFTTQVEFSVVEDGVINEINTGVRNSLSLAKSALNALEIASTSVENALDFSNFNFEISL